MVTLEAWVDEKKVLTKSKKLIIKNRVQYRAVSHKKHKTFKMSCDIPHITKVLGYTVAKLALSRK